MNKQSTVYKKLMSLYIIWGLWYIFFDSSIALRPYYQYLWPALVIGGLFLTLPSVQRNCRDIRYNSKLFLLFILICLVSTLLSNDLHASFLYTQKIFLAYGFAIVVTSNDNDKIIINCIIAYCTILLVISLIQLYFPPLYYAVFLPLINFDAETFQNGLQQGLAVGLTNGTSQNGLYMSIGFLSCAIYAIYKKKHKLLFSLLAILFFLMTFATGKRSYSIIIALELFVLFFFKFRGSNRINVILKIGFIGILIICVFSVIAESIPVLSSVIEKFNDLSSDGDVSNGRFDLYNLTWAAFESNNFQALGVNALMSVAGIETHNSYFQWIVEFGLLFCWIPIYYMLRVTIVYYKKVKKVLDKISDEAAVPIIMPFVFINQCLVSAFVALPFQWHNVMTLFFIFQLMLIRNISIITNDKHLLKNN